MCCSLAIAWPDGTERSVTAKLEGTIVSPRGMLGFGFDPCFQPTNSDKTFAEMTTMYRNQHNHRSLAFSLLSNEVCWNSLQPRN
jgi:XTP/dITP diphosphohydrolase